MPEMTDEQVARLDELDAMLDTTIGALRTAGQTLADLATDLAPKHEDDG